MEILKDNDRTILVIPRTGNPFIIILTGIWFIFLMLSFYLQYRDRQIFRDSEIITFNIAFLMVGLFVLKTFLWHVRGKEKITLDRETLKIERLGTFLTLPRKYETSLIDRFNITTINDGTWWSKLYGFSGGQISFDYWESTKHFGQTITKREAKELVDVLNDCIKNYTQQNV